MRSHSLGYWLLLVMPYIFTSLPKLSGHISIKMTGVTYKEIKHLD